MKEIVYQELLDDEIDVCRELCNELMLFQKSKATINTEQFDLMNYDTRMKVSYQNALASNVVVAYDGTKIVGYVFSTVEQLNEKPTSYPSWAKISDPTTVKGFYPDFLEYPAKVGCLNNIYIKDEYRDHKIGGELLKRGLQWLESFNDIKYFFVFISNGNYNALDFYQRHGFIYTHDVFEGFIYSAYLENKNYQK